MKLIRSFAAAVTLANLMAPVSSGRAASAVPPYIDSLTPLNRSGLYVLFSTNMDAFTAQDPSLYHINHGITVTNAAFVHALGTNGPQSVVRLDVQPPLGFFPDYSLTISNVLGEGGLLPITPNPTVLPFQLKYRSLGYLYLSPLPGTEYVSAQTRFVLVRFKDLSPNAVSNLSTFITVTGASSGVHSGQTHVASDGRTVIFTMNQYFSINEEVTVSLAPESAAGSGLDSYQYQFVIGGHVPVWQTITARGDNPPYQSKTNAFDNDPATKWLDYVVPNGMTNFSWIEYLYYDNTTFVAGQYALTSADDAPERDPADWNFYGVDASGYLVLLDSQTNQTFGSSQQRKVYSVNNRIAYRGYRLEITRVSDPSTATGVQLAELEFIQRQGGNLHEYSWSSSASALTLKADSPKPASASPKGVTMPNGVSVPSDFPQVAITARGNPSADYIWLDNVGQNGQWYKMILDTWGNPVFYQRGGGDDFKPQKNGMITWAWNFAFVGLDNNINYVRSYSTVNGYGDDGHELQIMADGSYFLIADGIETVDMSRYVAGGNPAAVVGDNVIQQFTALDELIFQWRAWDHLDIMGEQQFADLKDASVDFPHMNSIDVDDDGHILVSSRHISECTKIDRDTGEVIWRLGGMHSTLTFINDPLNGPRNQHCFRALGHGHYILFDNGNLHSPPVSRAVEYAVDPAAQTATLVWQFRDTPDRYAPYRGNVQRLTNGNTHINWVMAGYPKVCEVDSNGVKQLELNLTPGYDLYRSWRSPWVGVVPVPYLIVEPYPDNVTLIFNKFGDTNVNSYRIYGGTSPQPTTLLATTPSTLAHLSNLKNNQQYYFRVTAVANDGKESGYSNEENVMVNLVEPGQNMVQNGDFASGTNGWTWATANTGAGIFGVVTGACLIHITSVGTALTDLQLRRSGLELIQGKQYVLEFDGSAVGGTHPIDVKLGQDQSPFGIYYTASPSLRTTRQHFTYGFTITSATDLDARLMFNVGGLALDVVLDNISFYMAYNSQVAVTLATIPGGLTVNVDGTNYTAPASFSWATNSTHTASVADAQLSADGHARYPFLSWSDGGAQTHTVTTPRFDTNYTASFSTEFLLDVAVAPTGGGSVTPVPAGPWYTPNQLVSLTANPNPGFAFLSWNGVDTQSDNTAQATMSSYRNVTALFGAMRPISISIHSVVRFPDGSVQFGVAAPGAETATVLASTDLSTWQVLQTVPVTDGAAVFTDSAATNSLSRFYRVRSP